VPHRSLSWFLLASAAVTAVVWLQPLVTALLQGRAPELLDVYTTTVTYSLDLAVITPAAALAGLLVRRREPLGYLIAAPLLVTIVLLLPSISLATALQVGAGISFTPAQCGRPDRRLRCPGRHRRPAARSSAARRPHERARLERWSRRCPRPRLTASRPAGSGRRGRSAVA
jgi:hypothetical protein